MEIGFAGFLFLCGVEWKKKDESGSVLAGQAGMKLRAGGGLWDRKVWCSVKKAWRGVLAGQAGMKVSDWREEVACWLLQLFFNVCRQVMPAEKQNVVLRCSPDCKPGGVFAGREALHIYLPAAFCCRRNSAY